MLSTTCTLRCTVVTLAVTEGLLSLQEEGPLSPQPPLPAPATLAFLLRSSWGRGDSLEETQISPTTLAFLLTVT